MSALYDRIVAADDSQEFAHDHAAEILREMMMIEKVLTRWEAVERLGCSDLDYGIAAGIKGCTEEMREAMT